MTKNPGSGLARPIALGNRAEPQVDFACDCPARCHSNLFHRADLDNLSIRRERLFQRPVPNFECYRLRGEFAFAAALSLLVRISTRAFLLWHFSPGDKIENCPA
jgi:hypothetical protein